jgi:DNA-binding MarR family transcriptional regulator
MSKKYKNTNDILLEIDNDGELVKIQKDVKILTKHEERHFKKGEFFMAAFILPELILDKDYSGVTHRVLWYLLLHLDYNNRIRSFKQIKIAERLNVSQSNISSSLKKLLEDGVIYKRDEDYYFHDKYVKGAGDSKNQKEHSTKSPE